MNFKNNKISILLSLSSIILLVYICFRSDFFSINKIYYYIFYLKLSFVLFIFSILTFFLSNKIKIYLYIFIFSFVFSAYSFEIFLLSKILKVNSNKEDRRSKVEFFKEELLLDKDIKMYISPREYNYNSENIYSLGTISNSKNYVCNESGYYSSFFSDRYGFNNPDNIWDENDIEYLLIGDSFVLGSCVNKPNDFASILRNITNKNVLNLGLGGAGPLIEYAALKEYYFGKVKYILWFYYEGNDLVNLKSELSNNILKNYLDDDKFSQNLKDKTIIIDKLHNKTLAENLKSNSNPNKFDLLFKIIRLYHLRQIIKPPLENTVSDEFIEILKKVKKFSQKNNIEFYFIYLPTYSRYSLNFNQNSYNQMMLTLKNLDIKFIDLHAEVFQKELNPKSLFPFELKGHYNIEGYLKSSKQILKNIDTTK
tara:strand:+ start:1120 stop:2391 length:1272 start_codon:yes stop_codon:yes gene_type:complete